jgi:putative intracellular protease/amidase
MRVGLVIVGLTALLATRALAECEPKVVDELRQRGADDKLVTQICDIQTNGPSVLPVAGVCATNFGACTLDAPDQPIGQPCTCKGPMGVVSGQTK